MVLPEESSGFDFGPTVNIARNLPDGWLASVSNAYESHLAFIDKDLRRTVLVGTDQPIASDAPYDVFDEAGRYLVVTGPGHFDTGDSFIHRLTRNPDRTWSVETLMRLPQGPVYSDRLGSGQFGFLTTYGALRWSLDGRIEWMGCRLP